MLLLTSFVTIGKRLEFSERRGVWSTLTYTTQYFLLYFVVLLILFGIITQNKLT